MKKFKFVYANGQGVGWGKDYRHACRNMKRITPMIEIGMLVQVINNKKVTYWDGREFAKELEKGGVI